jgi:hypothetical protein
MVGDVINIKCPMPDCASILCTKTVEGLLDPLMVEKYHRFLKQKQNEHYRECHRCGSWIIGDPARPDMKCKECNAEFCFEHANAHPGVPCAQVFKLMCAPLLWHDAR